MNDRRHRRVKVPDDPGAAFRKALNTGFNILGYRNNTAYQLREKLTARGYDGETADAVIGYLKEHRFLNEERMLFADARALALTRLYGKSRIVMQLSLKHYAPETLALLDFEGEELCDIDFPEICRKLIGRRGGVLDGKTYAFLRRYGHTTADIRAGYRLYQEETGEEENASSDGKT